jgi:hypothetical protein
MAKPLIVYDTFNAAHPMPFPPEPEPTPEEIAQAQAAFARTTVPDAFSPGGIAAAASGPAQRALARLERLRSSLGTRLLAGAEHAYEAALRQANARVATRGRSRLSAGRQAQLAVALANHEPLRLWLAAVGITELEMLHGSFDAFAAQARAEFTRYAERANAVLERVGIPPTFDPNIDDAVAYLVAGLVAMTRRRLLLGDEAMLAAVVRPRLIPKLPRPSGGGYDLPDLPDPEELASAAARLVRNALRINEKISQMRLPTTPDAMPEVVTMEAATTLEEDVAATLTMEPLWTWVHGFYGEPKTDFEPHVELDGFETTDREGDPELTNTEAWPDGDTFYPGDHDGCTCEWVLR